MSCRSSGAGGKQSHEPVWLCDLSVAAAVHRSQWGRAFTGFLCFLWYLSRRGFVMAFASDRVCGTFGIPNTVLFLPIALKGYHLLPPHVRLLVLVTQALGICLCDDIESGSRTVVL